MNTALWIWAYVALGNFITGPMSVLIPVGFLVVIVLAGATVITRSEANECYRWTTEKEMENKEKIANFVMSLFKKSGSCIFVYLGLFLFSLYDISRRGRLSPDCWWHCSY